MCLWFRYTIEAAISLSLLASVYKSFLPVSPSYHLPGSNKGKDLAELRVVVENPAYQTTYSMTRPLFLSFVFHLKLWPQNINLRWKFDAFCQLGTFNSVIWGGAREDKRVFDEWCYLNGAVTTLSTGDP